MPLPIFLIYDAPAIMRRQAVCQPRSRRHERRERPTANKADRTARDQVSLLHPFQGVNNRRALLSRLASTTLGWSRMALVVQ